MKTAKTAKTAITLIVILSSLASMNTNAQLQKSSSVTTNGAISYTPSLTVTVNPNQIIGTNNLVLGTQLDWERFHHFMDRPEYQQLAIEANFKLIRVFDFRKISSYGYDNLMPCKQWPNEWDWTTVDALANAIFSIGAEPLFCLGWARTPINNYIPPGMPINSATGLPDPETYASYAQEWVKHFKEVGLPVKHYQIMNEPIFYFGWAYSSKLVYFADLWNAAAIAMRAQNPNILLSHDTLTIKFVLDYWIDHGEDIDYLDFHKYDAEYAGEYTDEQMFNRAETRQYETQGSFYGLDQARQIWFNARGKMLPTINSESNFDCAFETGSDEKIQQMTGAVWLALSLRTGIIKGLNYHVYFEFSSSKSFQQSIGTGWGFGMINQDNNQPWYPYYVNKMIGSNLAVGDQLLYTDSPTNDLRTLAWTHNGKTNILLIHKVTTTTTIRLQGLDGQINISWIDNTIPYENPRLQTQQINANSQITLHGYTVALLQTA